MTRFFACVPYYSLPEFPASCNLVRIHGVLLRDILLANPRNSVHRKIGFQYDPAIDVGEYRVCQHNTRIGLRNRTQSYDEMYLLFRTRYIGIDKTSQVLVTGFFKVNRDISPDDADPKIRASKMHFVSAADAIDVSETMHLTDAHISSPNSENPKWTHRLEKWFEHTKGQSNRIRSYRKLSQTLKAAFKAHEFKDHRYSECRGCEFNIASRRAICPLIRRQNNSEIYNASKYYNMFYPT